MGLPFVLVVPLSWGQAAAGDGAWSRAEVEPAAPVLAVRERTGAWLVAEGERLLRREGSAERTLGCTLTGGTGAILRLAPDPAGPTFVVAEHGLFLVDPEVEVADPIELGPGAPGGRVTSLEVDRERRLWVATTEAFGVCDPCFFWGRTLAGEAGPPAAGPYSVRAEDAGTLLLTTSAGTWRYAPDRGDPPRIRSLLVDGEPVEAGSALSRAHGATLRVRATAEAMGGASLRYRLDRHHVWRAFEGELVLGDIDPGRHSLELIALDRDLRRSPPFVLQLRVDYPFYYGKRFLVGSTLAAALLLLGFFVARARRAGDVARRHPLLSTGIALCLSAQVAAALFPHAKGWPFVGFTMYTQRYGDFDLVYDEILAGLRPNGASYRILEGALGVAVDSRWQVLGPLIDGGDEVARDYLTRCRQRHPNSPVVGIQVQARRRRLTEHGPVPVAALVLRHYAEDPRDG